jgi:hypothetical protein
LMRTDDDGRGESDNWSSMSAAKMWPRKQTSRFKKN